MKWLHAMNDKEAVISMDMMLNQSEKLAKMMGHVIVIKNQTNDRDMHLHMPSLDQKFEPLCRLF